MLIHLLAAVIAVVDGRVTTADRDASPVRTARVSVVGTSLPPVFTNADGAFELIDVPSTGRKLLVEKTGFASTSADISEPRGTIEIRLSKGAAISGRVIDENGEPVVGASVSAEQSGQQRNGVTDERGQYRIGDLAAGTYEIRVAGTTGDGTTIPGAPIEWRRAVSWEPTTATSVEVAAGDERSGIDVALVTRVGPAIEAGAARSTGAAIRGRITTADGRPVSRARVQIVGRGIPASRSVLTDRSGAYQFANLTAGEYLVSSAKPPFLATQYGQSHTFERGKTIAVGTDAVENIDITLQQGGAIAGRVVDENGDPVSGLRVQLAEVLFAAGRRQLIGVPGFGAQTTDDRGRYRIFGVPAGEYAVAALISDVLNIPSLILPSGYGTTYFPGRDRPADAQFVQIAAGGEIDDVNIVLVRGTGATIRGTVRGSDGKPLAARILVGTSQRSGGTGSDPKLIAADANGRFETPRLPPGEYVLQAIAGRTDVNAGREGEFASAFVTLNAVDVVDVAMQTTIGARVSGRITFEGDDAASYDEVWLKTVPSDFDVAPVMGPTARAHAAADGTFAMQGLHGPRRLCLMRAPKGWTLKTIRVNGREITDEPLPFDSDDSIEDVEVVLTKRAASVTGTVTGESSRRVDDYTAIVFAANADRWYQGTRFINFSRPGPDGTFAVTDLPPGEYYVVAVDWLRGLAPGGAGDVLNPSFLESLVPRASRITLSDGQMASVTLRLIVR